MANPQDTARKPRVSRAAIVVGVVVVGLIAMLGSQNNSRAPEATQSRSTDPYSISRDAMVQPKRDSFLGCRTRGDIDRLLDIVRSNDRQAFITMTMICPAYTADQGPFQVVETPFSDNVCVRPQGSVSCVWTNRGWLKPAV
jgi:hypothetical protein